MTNEQWKPITGYEGRYEISNLGRVRSLFGRVRPLKEPKVLSPYTYKKSQTSYERVELSNPSARFLVHRLVASHFIANPDNKPFINHIDNNGLNNHCTNLEWCTQSENLQHAQDQGRLTSAQSKGGKIQGEQQRAKALADTEALVGTTKGTWTVIKNLGFFPVGTKGIERTRLLCECSCGMHYEVDRYYFTKNNPKQCSNCKAKTKI